MKCSIAALTFALNASAAVLPRAPCTFTVTASGGQSGTLGELGDGQVRVGGGYAVTTFTINNGQITDSAGRGCILTPGVDQFQCNLNTAPMSGFAIAANGLVSYGGSTVFYACPATTTEYNIYTTPVVGQLKCVTVTLTASGCFSSGASSSSSSMRTSSSSIRTSSASSSSVRTSSSSVRSSSASSSSIKPANASSSSVRPTSTLTSSVKPSSSSSSVRSSSSSSIKASSSSTSAAKVSSMSTSSVKVSTTTIIVPVSTVRSSSTTSSVKTSSSSSSVRPSSASTSSIKVSSSSTSSAKASSASVSSVKTSTTTITVPASTVRTSSSSSSVKASSSSSSVRLSSMSSSSVKPSSTMIASSSAKSSSVASSTVKPSSSSATSSVKVSSSSAVAPVPATSVKSSSMSTSTVKASSTSPAASTCPTTLAGPYQFPHLIIPVDSTKPTTAAGTQYNGTITPTISSIYNFDIPATYTSNTCTLVFLFPLQSQLETSAFTFSGPGTLDFSQLSTVATQATTYANQGAVMIDFGVKTVAPGNRYVITSGACAAGQRISYEIKSVGGTSLNYFEDYNPSPIGLYITVC